MMTHIYSAGDHQDLWDHNCGSVPSFPLLFILIIFAKTVSTF